MKLLLLFGAMASTAFGYRILCLFPVPSKSHGMLAKGIVDPLLTAGHEITLITPLRDFWKPHKNLKLIYTETMKIVEGLDMTKPNNAGNMSLAHEFARNISTTTINNPAVKDTLVTQSFDAVVTESFFNDYDAGFAAVLQVPWILLCGVVMHPHIEELTDEVRSISTVPVMMMDLPVPMNFWQRASNVAFYALMWFSDRLALSDTTALYEQQYGPIAAARGITLPPFDEALHNISIMFVNTHESIAPAQSLPPNVINVAGYHISETVAPLPKDLQELLDSSPGFVYFSMGSVLKSSALPKHTRVQLIKVLGSLPYTVLWKFEEKLDDLPKNVHVRPWMPQASILAHPKIKAFITHGGLLSTLEAVKYGVPLLAVPVFGDQPANADRAVRAGYATKAMFSPEMAPELASALNKLLNDDKYYKKAKYLSSIFNNRLVAPSKLITYYVEMAIMTKGAYHLRSKSLLYSWYQRWMLDVLATIIFSLYIVYRLIKKLVSMVFRKESKKAKSNLKKKN